MNGLYLPLLVLLGGSVVPVVVVVARAVQACSWRRSLVAFQLDPPAALSAGEVSAWLAHIAAVTHPSRFALLPLPPVCVEVVSAVGGVQFYVLVVKRAEAQLLSGIRATMPGCRVREAQDYMARRPVFQVAAELIVTSRTRQLSVDRIEAASSTLLASLQPVAGASEILLQWILVSAGTPAPVSVAGGGSEERPWVWQSSVPNDAEAVASARAKQRDALLFGVARAGIVAPTRAQAYALFGRVWNNWHGLNAPGVRLRRRILPSFVIAERMTNRRVPLLRWPLTISAREAPGLLALPIGSVMLPGVALGTARQLPPPRLG